MTEATPRTRRVPWGPGLDLVAAFALRSRSTHLVQLVVSAQWRWSGVSAARALARRSCVRGTASGRLLAIGFPRGRDLPDVVGELESSIRGLLPMHRDVDRDWLAMLVQARRWDLVRLLLTSRDESARTGARILLGRSPAGEGGAGSALATVAEPWVRPWDVAPWQGEPMTADWSAESTLRFALAARDRRRPGVRAAIEEMGGDSRRADPPTFSEPSRVIPVLVHDAMPETNSGYTLRTHAVASELSRLGWDVRVLPHPFRTQAPRGTRWFDGVRYDTLAVDQADGFEAMLTAHTAALVTYLREAKAEIVMAASNYRNGLVASRAAKTLGIPFVYEVRGFWELSRAASEPSWRETDEFRSLVRMETSVARAADTVVTIADSMVAELVRRGVDRSRIVVARNGASAPAGNSEGTRTGSRPLRAVYAGAVVGYEGLDVLLRATAEARDDGADIELHIAGDGPELEALRHLAVTLGVAERTNFLGRLSAAESSGLVATADVVVLPRVSTEVTERVPSLKPLEAMSLGVPVVVTSLLPNREYYGSAPVRFLPPGEVGPLAALLGEAGRDPDAFARLGAEGRAWQADVATWRRTAEPIAEIFDHLLRTKRT